MSLKENVDFVKEELSSEEKFLESFVKVERFYKKNKLLILGVVAVVVIAVIGFYTTKYIQGQNKIEANLAFNEVLKDPKNSAALEKLKEKNSQLYEVAQYIQASKEGKVADVQIKFLKELSEYKNALNTKNADELNKVSMQNDFLLKEFALFNKALLLTNEGKFEEAKTTLKLIPEDSKVNDLVNVLKHYLVTK